ncbi:hypothetical protein MMP71_06120 [Acinetobacter dispersus]|uniref:hypothetical protein n=1 Tax=Acinetobacter dispersus TaxID=70348 RepID=UPI001F4B27F5|nr:hypothetical protein [Acinetobacter dispersus]MCH7383425.1 hypothetical protein [Acinetobacter dispersus]
MAKIFPLLVLLINLLVGVRMGAVSGGLVRCRAVERELFLKKVIYQCRRSVIPLFISA